MCSGLQQVSEALNLSASLQDQAWRAIQPDTVWLAGCRPGQAAVLYNSYIGPAVAQKQEYLQPAIFLLHAVAHQSPAGGIFDPPHRGWAVQNTWYGNALACEPPAVCSTGGSAVGPHEK